MSAVLIISICLLLALSFVIYRTKRKTFSSAPEPDYFPNPPRGLFSNVETDGAVSHTAKISADRDALFNSLIKRAEAGDLAVLVDANRTRDDSLYDATLNALIKRDPDEKNLKAISAFIIGGDGLRANSLLTRELLKLWKQDSETMPAADLLRIAALTSDAQLYSEIVEELVTACESGDLAAHRISDLRVLIGSEYWVLSPVALQKSSGFILKQKLAEADRRIAAALSRLHTQTNEPDKS